MSAVTKVARAFWLDTTMVKEMEAKKKKKSA